MTGAGILGWMLIGSLFGFVAGVIAAAAFAATHPLILEAWDIHRHSKQVRSRVDRILDAAEKLAAQLAAARAENEQLKAELKKKEQ